MGGGGEYKHLQDVPEAYPMAVELPAEMPIHQPSRSPPPRPSYESGHHDTLEVQGKKKTPSPRSSSENQTTHSSPRTSAPNIMSSSADVDRLLVHRPTPNQYRTAGGADKIAIVASDEFPKPKEQMRSSPGRVWPPPLPPKTPILGEAVPALPGKGKPPPPLPYPLDDGPPPAVNMARKPDYKPR